MIWNPGKNGAMEINDLPNSHWDNFLCIEPIIKTNPILLRSNEKFNGEMIVELIKLDSL
jgi:D-hexose-6-phosphate mutarotase